MTHDAATDIERLHILAARLRAWVLAVFAWVAGFESVLPRVWRRELRACVRDAERAARIIVVCVAAVHLRREALPPAIARTSRPYAAPRGFRRTRHRGDFMRGLMRGLRFGRGSLAARIARVRAVFARLGPHIAQMCKHVRRVDAETGLAPVAPPAVTLVAVCVPTIAHADTS